MSKIKTFNITSLATSEAKDLKRLSDQARKGWLLNDIKIPYLSYELKEFEGVDRDYMIDYNETITQEYLSSYKKKGWNYVCSNMALHYFYATKNNPPFYTNQAKKLGLYQKKTKQLLLALVLVSLTALATAYGFSYFSNLATPSTPVVSILFAATLLQIIMNVFFAYAAYTFFSKASHIKKKLNETRN
jgi:hypothetical protein